MMTYITNERNFLAARTAHSHAHSSYCSYSAYVPDFLAKADIAMPGEGYLGRPP